MNIDKIKNLLKRKPEKYIAYHDKKHQLLRRESVELNSVIDIDEDLEVITTKNKVKGKIYRYSFKVPIGLSPEIDEVNKRQLTQLLSSCHGSLKIWLLNEQKMQLHDNMKMLFEQAKNTDNERLKEVCLNRYSIMSTLEKTIYSTGYIFVEEGIYKFEELANPFLNIYQFQGMNLLNFIERINNDCYVGGGDIE